SRGLEVSHRLAPW
nr:Chain C, Peptide from Structure-specific endonuclease subunit SLX4 [Homo sapiens]4M7C_D Chain D, Peptide from Structure-specific endonuclease subunit SLX4 [Homo sapiens]